MKKDGDWIFPCPKFNDGERYVQIRAMLDYFSARAIELAEDMVDPKKTDEQRLIAKARFETYKSWTDTFRDWIDGKDKEKPKDILIS